MFHEKLPWITLATPTALEELGALSRPGHALWIKRDDAVHPLYGGNKARKLGPLLAAAREKKKGRLLTIGAAGSHHVLATAVFGGRAGFEVEAILVPQPRTRHVVTNLRAALAAGLVVRRALRWGLVPLAVLAARDENTFFIPVGGSTARGSSGYVAAGRELASQIRAGEAPEPDVLVVTLGSGGTAAGLAVGLAEEGLRTRVFAVVVSPPAFAVEALTVRLVRALARDPSVADDALSRLVFDRSWMGDGYGHDTPWGARARVLAARAGLHLDPTYTAKAFAAALAIVDDGRARSVLYWHTLSSAPFAPLLEGAPSEDECLSTYSSLLPGREELRAARGGNA